MKIVASILAVVVALSSTSSIDAFQSSSSFARGTSLATNVKSTSSLCMKTIAVFGASGLTGSECVYQALQDGDDVVGLTRNPSNLKIPKGSGGADADKPLTDPKLTMIAGDVTKKSDVDKVFEKNIDGVIVALGGKTSDVGETMLTDGTKNIIAAMKEKGVKRIAVVTSIGAGGRFSRKKEAENRRDVEYVCNGKIRFLWCLILRLFLLRTTLSLCCTQTVKIRHPSFSRSSCGQP